MPIKRHKLIIAGLPALLVIAGGFLLFQSGVITRALTANNVTPSSGPTVGGNIITITGSGFEPDIPTMQNFGADKCASMTVYDGSNIGALLTLKDTRNDQTYTVGKLADGNCWVLNNLKLGSETAPTPLTPSDTNISQPRTMPQIDNTVISLDYDTPRVYAYSPQSSDIYDPTFYGYHYNWCAATSGDPVTCTTGAVTPGNATQDICPARWQLPKGGVKGDPSNDFDVLNAKMAGYIDNSSQYQTDFSPTSATFVNNWQFTGPWRGVLSGIWYYGAFGLQGSNGVIWSSSSDSGNPYHAIFADFDSTWLNPNDSWDRSFGMSVRCIAKTSTNDNNLYDPKPTVTVDGVTVDPSNVELVSDSELRVRMPAHLSGMVNVVITLGAETRTVQYEYVDLPVPVVPGAPNTGKK